MKICWESRDSDIFINPTYANSEKERFQRILNTSFFSGHLWLATSGSAAAKWVGLSKEAILTSAQTVNRHLHSQQEDRWVNALPDFHIGGLAIWARAYLSGATICDFKKKQMKWCAVHFHTYLEQEKGTLTSLVPTQLYDLVMLGLKAPKSLRAMIIGGGKLMPHLYERAIELGWPLLPSYGMTECASQIATASLDDLGKEKMPPLYLLPHIQGYENEGSLAFSGNSLFSVYAYLNEREVTFSDPKVNGWFLTEDQGSIINGAITVQGRVDDKIKIGGENVDLSRLEALLQTLCMQMGIKGEMTLVAMPDFRLGHYIHLVSNSSNKEEIIPLLREFQHSVLPFERIRKLSCIQKIPRSPLNKIIKKELTQILEGSAAIEVKD